MWQAESYPLVEWVYRMVIDVLESGFWKIKFRYLYYDKKRKAWITLTRAVIDPGERYKLMDACVDFDSNVIFIHPESQGERELCLFHECLEILFAEWKDEYYVPKRWELEKNIDPIMVMEAATWDQLTCKQKNTIKSYLPKGP